MTVCGGEWSSYVGVVPPQTMNVSVGIGCYITGGQYMCVCMYADSGDEVVLASLRHHWLTRTSSEDLVTTEVELWATAHFIPMPGSVANQVSMKEHVPACGRSLWFSTSVQYTKGCLFFLLP